MSDHIVLIEYYQLSSLIYISSIVITFLVLKYAILNNAIWLMFSHFIVSKLHTTKQAKLSSLVHFSSVQMRQDEWCECSSRDMKQI